MTRRAQSELEWWLVRGLLIFVGSGLAIICGRNLWQYRAALTPWALLIGGAWVFQRNVLRRQS